MTVNRRFVVVSIVLVIVPSIGVQAQGFSPGPPLVVVDSNGTEVGHLLEDSTVVVMVNDLAVGIQVHRYELTSWAGYELFFTQPDCMGDVYLAYHDFLRVPLAPGAMGPTGMLFVADPNSAAPPVTSLSKYNYDHQACYNQTNDLIGAWVANPTVNLATMFVRPFSVRPASSTQQAGVPMPALNLQSAALFILVLCCIGFIRLRSAN